MNILLIEDNLTIAKGLQYTFSKMNYNLIWADSIKSANNYLNNDLNLIILDVMLPDGNGFTYLKNKLRKLNIPVIILTAKDEEDDIVKGLNLAEDYLTKPFSTKELLARVNKILLRIEKKNIIKIQDISYDLDKMIVKKNNEIILLSPIELHLLNTLFININHVVSRNKILDIIFEVTGNDVSDHTVTVYFKRIREKLGSDIIKTIKGVGYLIEDEK